MGTESALVKTSDILFKISFYPCTCPKSLKWVRGMIKKLLFHVGPFSRLLRISCSAWDFVFSSHRHTHARTYSPDTCHNLHASSTPFIPKPAQLISPTFQPEKAFSSSLPKLQGNARTEVQPPCLSPLQQREVCLSSHLEHSQHRRNVHALSPSALFLSLYKAHKTKVFQKIIPLPSLGSFLIGAP